MNIRLLWRKRQAPDYWYGYLYFCSSCRCDTHMQFVTLTLTIDSTRELLIIHVPQCTVCQTLAGFKTVGSSHIDLVIKSVKRI